MFVICNYTNLLYCFICCPTNLYPTHCFNPLAQYLAIKHLVQMRTDIFCFQSWGYWPAYKLPSEKHPTSLRLWLLPTLYFQNFLSLRTLLQRNWTYCTVESPGPGKLHSCEKLFSLSELGWSRKVHLSPCLRWFRREVIFSLITTSWVGKSVLIPLSKGRIFGYLILYGNWWGGWALIVKKAKYSLSLTPKILVSSDRRREWLHCL